LLAGSGTLPSLTYYYTTELEEYEDGSSANFLVGEMHLKNINTFNMDDTYSIRMSVGWRDPQRDAYDVTSFNVKYNTDNTKIEFMPVDGYSYGSIDSKYYNFDQSKQTGDGVDYNGNHNSTIKQWTDFIVPQGGKSYREEEPNDIEVL